MCELTPEEIKIPKDMVAWILKRLNGKDASEFMLALSVNKPLAKSQGGFKFIRTSEQKKAHKAYVESLKKLEEGCPECKGEKTKLVKRPNGRETRIDYRCPTCQGTGEAKKLAPELEMEIHKITSLLARRVVGEASKKALSESVIMQFNKEADDLILALMEGK